MARNFFVACQNGSVPEWLSRSSGPCNKRGVIVAFSTLHRLASHTVCAIPRARAQKGGVDEKYNTTHFRWHCTRNAIRSLERPVLVTDSIQLTLTCNHIMSVLSCRILLYAVSVVSCSRAKGRWCWRRMLSLYHCSGEN